MGLSIGTRIGIEHATGQADDGAVRAVATGGEEAVRQRQGRRRRPMLPRAGPRRRSRDPVDLRPQPARPAPRAATSACCYEDGHILIVDKPAGLLTQPTQDRERDTLLERAGRYLSEKHGIRNPYVGIVHRLDKDTTGAILLVTAARSLRPFQAMFREHAIERCYLAVVEGVFLTPSGRIDLPLVADRGDGRRGVARAAGRGPSRR